MAIRHGYRQAPQTPAPKPKPAQHEGPEVDAELLLEKALPASRGARVELLTAARQSLLEDYLKNWHFGGRMLHGVLPFALASILLPSFLTWLRAGGQSPATYNQPAGPPWDFGFLCSMALKVGLGSGLFSLVVGALILKTIRGFPRRTPFREWPYVASGIIYGLTLHTPNLPGYGVAAYCPTEGDPLWFIRFVALFAMLGYTFGGWVGWQAYREKHPEREFAPHTPGHTLVLVALAWVLILASFLPQSLTGF